MKVTTSEIETKATVRRVARITGDRPVVQPDGYRRAFAVDTVVIDYTWKDGRFVVDDNFAVHLDGPWQKKDGQDAKDRAVGMRPERVHYTSQEWKPEYAFLAPIIELLRPFAELAMATLDGAEVGV